MGMRRNGKILCGAAAGVCLAAAGFWLACPPPLEETRSFPSGLILRDRDGEILRVGLGPEDQDCRPTYAVSREDWIVKAAVAAEDRNFWRHPGVDVPAVLRACFQNLAAFRTVSGASTITMQTVRLLRPRRRTLWAKAVEAVQAVRLERALSKEEILGQYLNRAPFGSNLVGIEAAARGWFGKPPGDLNLGEAALLAGILQSPTFLRPDRHLDRALKRRAYVLGRMAALGMADAETLRLAAETAPVLRRAPRPFAAPYFCDWARRLCGRRSGDFTTTLDRPLQEKVRACLERHAKTACADLAGVVIEVKSGAVRAMACTGDYFSKEAGQVNTAAAPRPAGSTLKPFLFALAMDGGMIAPETMMADVPRFFGNHAPQNFSGRFTGPVSARDALILSLNIPAVDLAERVGVRRFYGTLKRLGLRGLTRPPEAYGLGLALGNGSVSLVDLANAYACLARGGVWRPCAGLEAAGAGEKGDAVFSPAACWLVADILGGGERSMDAVGHSAEVRLPPFAWKTGTSSGFRDAWTVAWNPDYAVGVWCGLKSGRRTGGRLVGKESAAPVAWEIARMLYPDGAGPWFRRPESVFRREVCALSGAVPAPECPERVTGWAIRRCSSDAPCALHVRGGDGRTVVRWPSALAAFFRARADGAAGAAPETALKITAPAPGSVFRLVDGVEQRIACKTSGAAPGEPVFWFCDDVFEKQLPGGAPFFWAPLPGSRRISCATVSGESDAVEITVEGPGG